MDMNDYTLTLYVHERLAAARARADRRRLVALAPERPALRVRVGVAFIRLGEWVQGCAVDAAPVPRQSFTHG